MDSKEKIKALTRLNLQKKVHLLKIQEIDRKIKEITDN